MGKCADQIEKYAAKYDARLRAIARTAVQDTISLAQKTRPEGGRMRIQTGFLRASINAAVNVQPKGPTKNEGTHGGKSKYPVGSQAAGKPVAATLLEWDPLRGDRLYVGWTANYARPREYKDGFLRGAVEKWDSTVKKAVKKVESRLG